MLLGAALDVGAVRIEHRVDADGVGVGAEEVGQVDRLEFLVGEVVLHLLCAADGHVTGHVHVADHDVGTAHEVDPVLGGLGVLRVLRDHPAVEPDGEAFLREGVAEIDAHFGGLFDGPHAVAAPVQADPAALLRHLVLAEIGLPARHERLDLLHELLDGSHGGVGGIEHQLVSGDLALAEIVLAQIEDDLREDVASGILDEDLVGELGVAQDIPGRSFLIGHVLGVVEDAGGAPHVADGVVVGVLAVPDHLVEAVADVGRQVVVDIVRGLAEVTVDREEQVAREHALDDVVRRTHDIVVLVALLDLGEHRLVDVEGLVDDADRLAGLLFVPRLKLTDDGLVDVVGPVVHFQDLLPILTAAAEQGCRCQKD